jgi:hypothetical protein
VRRPGAPVDVPDLLNVREIGRPAMDDCSSSGTGQSRRLTLAAIATLGLAIGAIAYVNFDKIIDLAKSVTSGQTGRAQSRFHY